MANCSSTRDLASSPPSAARISTITDMAVPPLRVDGFGTHEWRRISTKGRKEGEAQHDVLQYTPRHANCFPPAHDFFVHHRGGGARGQTRAQSAGSARGVFQDPAGRQPQRDPLVVLAR